MRRAPGCARVAYSTGSQIALTDGQSETCTITNDDVAARLTLVKVVVNDDGGTKTAADFALSCDGADVDHGSDEWCSLR